jgi:hypothetical protein
LESPAFTALTCARIGSVFHRAGKVRATKFWSAAGGLESAGSSKIMISTGQLTPLLYIFYWNVCCGTQSNAGAALLLVGR